MRGTGSDLVALLVYLDDVLLAGSTSNVAAAKAQFMSAYDSHDLRSASCFLGFEIVRDRSASRLWIGRTKLISDTLQRYAA